jgi:hypothetical protein
VSDTSYDKYEDGDIITTDISYPLATWKTLQGPKQKKYNCCIYFILFVLHMQYLANPKKMQFNMNASSIANLRYP